LTADPRKEKKSSGQNARRPGRDHLVTGGGIIQESLGAIIPLQTGGFVGIGIKELKPYIVGWRGYFGFCQTPRVLTNLEAWIRRRLRLYLWRQWRTRQNRFAELRRRGVAQFAAAVAAGSPTGLWRMSGHPAVQQALRNAYFESLGLPRIYAPAQA
jgi:hypothetical protein